MAAHSQNQSDQGQGRGWYGDSKGHALAGRKGGRSQGRDTNPSNFANDRQKAQEAGRKGGRSSQ